ncbi:hypothetical protein ES708_21109 [subsurface metagenome]
MGDAPDWITDVQVTVIVENTPVPSTPANEKAITRLDRLTTSDTEYDTVVTWTVTAAKIGILRFVEMESDNYELTRFQLTIDGVVQFTGIQIEASLTLEWPDVKLAAGAIVLLEAASSDGTEVNVDGDILGKEVG